MCPVLCEQEGEDAAQFANRVKSAIAHQGGLLDLPWWGSPPSCPPFWPLKMQPQRTALRINETKLRYFFQGWRTQTAESEGFLQRGAAEDVQQHHRGTERELAKQLLGKHRGRW